MNVESTADRQRRAQAALAQYRAKNHESGLPKRSTYISHNGKRAIERRLRQAAKQSAKG